MLVSTLDVRPHRKPGYPVADWIINRWSPRAMSGEPLSDADLGVLFEAARWAPSCYNEQPWRFIYARRATAAWPQFLDLLMEANRVWCAQAAALVVILAKKTFTHNGQPNGPHQFDAGAAWENLALQGAAMRLVVHGMAGFDYEKARTALGVPEDFVVCAMAAIGKPGNIDDLPEKLRAREIPSPRKPLAELVMEGRYRA